MYWSAIAAKVIDRRIILLEHLILKNNWFIEKQTTHKKSKGVDRI
jgi:hypothetical protein